MKCRQAKRLFGAYWDDEITQAEREWLEGHFTACATCRSDYEAHARSLELLASLPRMEPAPDLAERALARARRASTAPDRIRQASLPWAPLAAAAAALVVVGMLLSPWIGPVSRVVESVQVVRNDPPATESSSAEGITAPVAVTVPPSPASVQAGDEPLAAMSDSLFDHSEDIEFILDPVTVRRGRPSMTRSQLPVQGEQAVISF